MLTLINNGVLSLRYKESEANYFSSSFKSYFAISNDPTRYEQVLPENFPYHRELREAMDEDMKSVARFKKYSKVPETQAQGRKILQCRWAYKSKLNQDGEACRYRARIFFKGFLHRPYDSFNPDKTFSPVVHTDLLRLFLSVSAATNLPIY
jgi:hypothetical protein